MAFYDVVIVGSGFGGSVMAARLGAHLSTLPKKGKVLLLEKGWDPSGVLDPRSDGGAVNAQGNRFVHTLSPEHTKEVAQVFTDTRGAYKAGASSMNVIAGKGLGGGSNVYDGVSLRAPTEAFEQVRDGRRLWPVGYGRAALDPFYAVVEQKLGVRRLAWTDAAVPHGQLATKRDFVFAEGCRRIGATAVPLKLADSANDANEGWWNQGQRFEGRQDLTKNYLRDAHAAGVTMWSGCEVTGVAPTKTGYVLTGFDHRGGAKVPLEVECRLLVIAGGAVGSTALLLRSEAAFGDARALDPLGLLGKQVSGNGDYGVSGSVGRDFEHDVEGHKGKPMSSFCPSFFAAHKFVLIPFYTAPLYLALGQPSTLLRAHDPKVLGRGRGRIALTSSGAEERDWGLDYKKRLSTFGSRMLTIGCLAIDQCEGAISLGRSDEPEVSWRETSPVTEARWSAAVDVMRRIYDALGGEMYLDAYRKDGTVSTAHPLGGCRMTERTDPSGVVDPFGESLRNRNLFVVDAAVIPSALGVNPSLTIAAVAERIADALVRGAGTESLASRLTG